MKEKIDGYIEKRNLTLERTPAKPKKADLTDNTTSPATSNAASKEGAPSTQPAAKDAKKAETQQGKSL